MARTPHTGYWKRTKILVVLKDGTKIIDRFVDKKSGYMILEACGRIAISEIKNTGPYKDRSSHLVKVSK